MIKNYIEGLMILAMGACGGFVAVLFSVVTGHPIIVGLGCLAFMVLSSLILIPYYIIEKRKKEVKE